MQTLHAPELRLEGARNLVRTASGIRIGSAYIRPPERQSDDAERVQRALLAPPPQVRVTFAERIARFFRATTEQQGRGVQTVNTEGKP